MTALRSSMEAIAVSSMRACRKNSRIAKATLWPFGLQVFFCNKPIKSVADFKGLKIRSFTPTMSAMLQNLGYACVIVLF